MAVERVERMVGRRAHMKVDLKEPMMAAYLVSWMAVSMAVL